MALSRHAARAAAIKRGQPRTGPLLLLGTAAVGAWVAVSRVWTPVPSELTFVATSGHTTRHHAAAAASAAALAPRGGAHRARIARAAAAAPVGDSALSTPVLEQEPAQQFECNDDADCKLQPCPPKGCRTGLPVRIDDIWYDLGGWLKRHPGGAQFIEYYNGRDATEVMHAFHSDRARKMFTRLPKLGEAEAAEMDRTTTPVSEVTRNFRALRAKLEQEGWWERDLVHEAKLLGILGALFGGGFALAHLPGWGACLSIVPLALACTQSGWLGHDFTHGVDELSDVLRYLGPLGAGLSPTWWSDKHNKHHAVTNQMGADEDIATAPVLYTWAPHPDDDSPVRSLQSYLWPVYFSTLFLLWRFDSIVSVVKNVQAGRPNAEKELLALTVHWIVILTNVPLPIIPAFVLLSGLISATIVTATHQSEELFPEFQDDWVTAQFKSTRDAATRTAFTEWLWGGMQYQLEHHLFPSMPRSRYPKLAGVLRQFAEENKVPGGYRVSDEVDLVFKNIRTYQDIATAASGSEDTPRVRDETHVTGVGYQFALK